MNAVQVAPARGTRPGNRRELIVRAAWQLFVERGYANVGMGDIAGAVNIGASALYRHFGSKAELLGAVVDAAVLPFADVAARATPGDLEGLIESMASCTLDHRSVGILWQREARNLSDGEQRGIRDALRTVTRAIAAGISASRPGIPDDDADFLAWCIMGALVSIGFHSIRMPRPEFERLLVELCTTIARLELAPPSEPAPTVDASPREGDPSAGAAGGDRRDEIITSAIELFAERGYGAVGVDDIADAVGIAGPSIYAHFDSKQAVLVAAIERGSAVLDSDASEALAMGSGGRETMERLFATYVDMAASSRFVIRVLLSEMAQLPDEERAAARAQQVAYIDVLVALLREYTDLDATTARVRVQAALLVVNDAVQTRHLRARPDFAAALRQVAGALLEL